MKPRVVDAFPYWRERWAVEARLRLWAELAPDVDYMPFAFVGDRTHRGEPLPDGLPPVPAEVAAVRVKLDADSDWGREEQQRDAVTGLLSQMAPDDLVLLTDADELVDPRRIDEIAAATEKVGPVKVLMSLYFYGTRWRWPHPWGHAAACRARDLPLNPSKALRTNFHLPAVPTAGWHISYVGDVDQKLRAFAHSEADTDEFRESCRLGAERGTNPGGNTPLLDEPLSEDIRRLVGI